MKPATTTILLALGCAGCAVDAEKTSWSSTVRPYDQPPVACEVKPPPPPKPPAVSHDGRMAAEEYQRLKNAYSDLSNGYEQCQEWARSQR